MRWRNACFSRASTPMCSTVTMCAMACAPI